MGFLRSFRFLLILATGLALSQIPAATSTSFETEERVEEIRAEALINDAERKVQRSARLLATSDFPTEVSPVLLPVPEKPEPTVPLHVRYCCWRI